MLTIPEGHFRAYLFDCDGTIADSMPLHHKAWLKALAPWGGQFPLPLFYAWAGRPTKTIVGLLNQKFGLSMPPDVIDREREDAYLASLHLIEAIEDVVAHVHSGHGRIPMAVVSGSPRESVIRTLTSLKLLDRFDLIVGAEDYTHGKPSPEPFLKAAAALGIAPQDCLVFEDADLGIESAKAAGMSWVKLPPPIF
ncbi:MAG: HAD family phosphatase [Bdellovibrionota bacterium]